MSRSESASPRRGGNPDPWSEFLARYGLPGFLGTLLIMVGSLGVGWLPLDTAVRSWPLVDVLRDSSPGLILSRLMIFAGVAALLQTWLVTGFDLMSGHRWNTWRMSALMGAWSAPLLFGPPLFSRDVYSYFGQGRLLLEGYDPYTTGVSVLPGWFSYGADPMWGEAAAPYGPLFLLLSRGIAAFSGNQAFLAAIMFRLLAVVGIVLMLVAIPKLAERHGLDPAKALWLSVLNPLVIMHFVAGAHNDALMVGLVLVGFALALEFSPLVGAAAIGLATSVKPIALLALPFIGLIRAGVVSNLLNRAWNWVLVSISAVAAFGVTALLAGVGMGWVNALSTPGEVKTWLSPPTALGMAVGGALQALGLAPGNDGAVAFFRLIGLVASLAIVAYLCVRPKGRSAVRGAALAFGAVVVLGPVIQPWYLLWVLPLFAVTGLSAAQLRWTILLTAAFAVHGMAESSATADTLLELTDLVAIAVAIGIVLLILLASPRERQLVLKGPGSRGLQPETPSAQARADSLVILA
ncbi:MAG: polyprenol phosphomannose-dependent alpha 1,6 mannosyltransferase MptB [Candidatus Nanopelagicales bacterium]|nr:polyprenol phosphomannose-dependent alpha 1,6 mannosyltransferase MptB [Candidatus Nanopelagicales bacterium]